MATVKVKFRPSTVKDHPGTIVYVITHRRVAKTVTTGYRIFPHEWDERHARLLPPDNPAWSSVIRTAILRMRSDMERMDAIIGNLGGRATGYSSDDVVAEFRRTGGENTLFNFTERVIERLLQLKRVGTARNYRAALCSFKRFCGNMDLPLEEIDTILVEDYQAYLKLRYLLRLATLRLSFLRCSSSRHFCSAWASRRYRSRNSSMASLQRFMMWKQSSVRVAFGKA